MPHFFIKSTQMNGNTIDIFDRENYHHIVRSLRSRTGENLLLIDENGVQYETVITEITGVKITVKIEKFYPSSRFLDFKLYLAQSPLHSDAQGIIIEKSTELGVFGVYPVLTDNCTLNKTVIEKKISKWQKIMHESSKQCQRAFEPVCFEVTTIDKLLADGSFDTVIVFCERIAKKTMRDVFLKNPIKKGDKVLVIIGPEGGFSQKEFDLFQEKNLEMLTLGDLILRAETAVTVGLGNLIYEYSNFKR